MRKISVRPAYLIAAAAVCLACVSCGSGKKKVDIEGKWKISDEPFNGGYIFGSDDLADVYVYPENTYLSDGGFFIYKSHIPKDGVSFDGDILSLKSLNEELLLLDRDGEPDKDSYQGNYRVVSGKMREAILQSLGVKEADSAVLDMTIEGEKIRFTAIDVLEYSFDGKKIKFKGKNGLPDSSGDAELSDNRLTIKRSDGGSRVLIKENEGEQK